MTGMLDVQIPVILWFKRQAIRNFPDNTRVATYYNDRINKTITVPFSIVGVSEGTVNEVSKKTLGTYIRKSALDVADTNYAAGYRTSKAGKELDEPVRTKREKRKWSNRIRGITLATKKISEDHSTDKLKQLSDELSTKIKNAVDKFNFKVHKDAETIDMYKKNVNHKTGIREELDKDEVEAYKQRRAWRSKKKPEVQVPVKEELDKDEIEAYKLRRAWKKSKKPVNEVSNENTQRLKQIKKWINNTRVTMGAQEISRGKASDVDSKHLDNLNKEKKDLVKSIKKTTKAR